MTWPVHDRRGITDAADVVENLPKALKLPGGIWNFGSANGNSTYETVRSVLEAADRQAALARLTPNLEAFAQNPRDISMDMTRLEAAGITFPTTGEAILRAII